MLGVFPSLPVCFCSVVFFWVQHDWQAKSAASAPSAVGLVAALGGPAHDGLLCMLPSSGQEQAQGDGALKGKGKVSKRGAEKQFWCRLCESYAADPGKKKYCLACNRSWECALTRAKAAKQVPMLQDVAKDLPLLRRFLQAQEEALGPSLGHGWRRGGASIVLSAMARFDLAQFVENVGQRTAVQAVAAKPQKTLKQFKALMVERGMTEDNLYHEWAEKDWLRRLQDPSKKTSDPSKKKSVCPDTGLQTCEASECVDRSVCELFREDMVSSTCEVSEMAENNVSEQFREDLVAASTKPKKRPNADALQASSNACVLSVQKMSITSCSGHVLHLRCCEDLMVGLDDFSGAAIGRALTEGNFQNAFNLSKVENDVAASDFGSDVAASDLCVRVFLEAEASVSVPGTPVVGQSSSAGEEPSTGLKPQQKKARFFDTMEDHMLCEVLKVRQRCAKEHMECLAKIDKISNNVTEVLAKAAVVESLISATVAVKAQHVRVLRAASS
eukprot:6492212-Amphidinium_carterae.2